MAQIGPRIRLVKDEWTPLIKKLSSRQTRHALDRAGKKTANAVARNLRIASRRWRSISRNIKVKKRGAGYNVNGPLKGIYLDSMKPHYVSLRRGRAITAWAMRKSVVGAGGRRRFKRKKSGKSYIQSGRRGGITGGSVYVTPTPWIQKPLRRGMQTARKHLRVEVNKLLKKTGG